MHGCPPLETHKDELGATRRVKQTREGHALGYVSKRVVLHSIGSRGLFIRKGLMVGRFAEKERLCCVIPRICLFQCLYCLFHCLGRTNELNASLLSERQIFLFPDKISQGLLYLCSLNLIRSGSFGCLSFLIFLFFLLHFEHAHLFYELDVLVIAILFLFI